MALWLVPERPDIERDVEICEPLTLTPGVPVTVGKRDVDKKDGKLSKVLFRIVMKSDEEAAVTRVGRTTVYVQPKGETGKLTMKQEGSQKNDSNEDACTERVFLGDSVVVCGTEKKSLVLLPAGQTWYEWAEGQSARDELRALELKTLGGRTLEEEEIQRQEELQKVVQRSLEARSLAAQEALAEAERRATKDARGQGRDIDKKEGQGKEGEGAAGEGSGLNEASGLPPAPPHALLDILGEEPPEFSSREKRGLVREDAQVMMRNLEALAAMKEGEKLWVCLESDLVRSHRGGSLLRMFHRQGRATTAAWTIRFHSKVRSFVEKEIVQLEIGQGSPSLMQEMSSKIFAAVKGLQGLRRMYSGDTSTQDVLGRGVKELTLTAKMCESYLKRLRGENKSLMLVT